MSAAGPPKARIAPARGAAQRRQPQAWGAPMTLLWPEMLWLLLLVPAVVAAYLLLLRRKKKNALRYASLVRHQGCGECRSAPAAPRAAAALPRGVRADARRDRASRGRGHAAVAARNGDPLDGRLGQHARHGRQAEPDRGGAGGGARVRRASSRRPRASASSHSPPRLRSSNRRRTAARTSSPRSSGSSCSGARPWAAGSWSR